MVHASGEVTRDQLIAYAGRQGYEGVTEHQLVRWHKFGLLPRPHRKSLGRGRGTESRYPHAACSQLVALLALREQGTTKLEALGWGLWWARYPVTNCVRTFLIRRLQRVEQDVRGGLERFEAEDPNNPIDRAPQVSRAYGLGRVRRRMGSETFPTLVRVGMEVLLGEFEANPLHREDFPLLAHGLTFGRTRRPSGSTKDPKAEQFVQGLEILGSEINLIVAREAIEEASDASLERARAELHVIFQALFPLMPTSQLPMSLFLAWFLLRTLNPTLSRVVDEFIYQPWSDPNPELQARLDRMRSELGDVRRAYEGQSETERNNG